MFSVFWILFSAQTHSLLNLGLYLTFFGCSFNIFKCSLEMLRCFMSSYVFSVSQISECWFMDGSFKFFPSSRKVSFKHIIFESNI